MYPKLYKHIQEARQGLQKHFKDVPKRSPANSIAASYAAWNAHEPAILSTFKRIKRLAHKVERAEYEWVRKVTKEIQMELDTLQIKLAECALGSPEE